MKQNTAEYLASLSQILKLYEAKEPSFTDLMENKQGYNCRVYLGEGGGLLNVDDRFSPKKSCRMYKITICFCRIVEIELEGHCRWRK